jgi:hypothetical protein
MSDTDLDLNLDIPSSPTANTADVRENWRRIQARLEAIETQPPQDLDFLPLTGGALTGPLSLPDGTALGPALTFGAIDDTGLYRVGMTLGMAVGGVQLFLLNATTCFLRANLDLGGAALANLADPTAPTNALNLRTADARYAPVSLVAELRQLRDELKTLRNWIDRYDIHVPAGVGMRTELLSP